MYICGVLQWAMYFFVRCGGGRGCALCERCTFVAFLQYVHLCFFAVGDVLFWCDVVGSGGILFCVRDVLLWCGVMVDGCVRS